MTRAVLLFVHGTGVRSAGYAETYNAIKATVAERGLPVELRGCFWGGSEGARLHQQGRSVPEYLAAGGGRTPSPEDVDAARWTVLYLDPWYELRLLRNYPGDARPPFGQQPPSAQLRRRIEAYRPSRELADRMRVLGLDSWFTRAHEELLRSPELGDALKTAHADPLLHRQAIARALVAQTLVASEEAGLLPWSGMLRDWFVAALMHELGAEALAASDFLLRPVLGLATRIATSRRGQLVDKTVDPGGDVLRFLARGDTVRAYVRLAIDRCSAPLVVLGHSLGGIIAVDVLVRDPAPSVRQLITVGSQAPFLYEIGALPCLEPGTALPQHFPPWLNVYDRRDLLSYVGAAVFPQRVVDRQVDNGRPFPESHSAYWRNPEVWDAVEEALP